MLSCMRKKLFILAMVAISVFSCLFAADDTELSATTYDGAFDYFLSSDVPICYGEERFRERILERTKGERDPIGLVLTGGSARALAHVGVLEYLEEQGIEPDFIVANSMGSIIGLLYAAGLEPRQISEVVNVGDISNYFSFTLPIKGGLLDPSSFKTLVQSVMGYDLRIEDLPIPVMVICDDLVTKREIRICEGNFADVLIASFALPVYFPPQFYNGHLLMDGGIKSLAPIDAAYDYTDTVVISTTFYDLDSINLINPITILNGAFDIGKRQRAASDMKKYDGYIWIRCNVEQFSFMDFKSADTMAALGYEAAEAEADALSMLYRSGTSSLSEHRRIYDVAIEKAKNNLYYFDRIESTQVSNLLDICLTSNQSTDYPYYLKDSISIGFEYFLRYRMAELSIQAGGAFDTANSKEFRLYPELSIGLDLYPFAWMRMSLFGSVDWNSRSWIPSYYLRQGLDFKAWHYKDIFDMGVSQTLEYYGSSDANEGSRYLFSVLLNNSYFPSWGNVDLDLGYLVTGRNLPEIRNYLQFDFMVRYKAPFGIFADCGLMMRGAVDGLDGVPLFISDGYVTATNRNNVGYYDPVAHPDRLMSIIRLSAGWLSPEFTLAEFLMFDKVELSAYFDMLLFGVDFNFSTGVEVQAAASIIGLVEIPLRIRVGYDSMSEGPVVSTVFATRF